MGIMSSNLNLILDTIMSSFGINFVKKCLLVCLPFLLPFQMSCVHRILKRVISSRMCFRSLSPYKETHNYSAFLNKKFSDGKIAKLIGAK